MNDLILNKAAAAAWDAAWVAIAAREVAWDAYVAARDVAEAAQTAREYLEENTAFIGETSLG